MSDSRLRGKSERRDGSRSNSNANLGPKPPDIPPDIIFKMSKKIAQLTKVIYYLNTKNEDHNAELQNLIDAYELEIGEVIHDGENAIDEFRFKLDEGQLRLKAQDEAIMSYVENAKKQEAEITELRNVESQLRRDLIKAESETSKKGTAIRKSAETATPPSPAAASSADATTEMKRGYEDKIADMTSQYEQRIQSLKLEWATEVEDVKDDYSKKLRLITEEQKKTEDTLKRTIDGMKTKTDEETNKFQTEIRRLKQTVDEQEKEFKSQFAGLEKRLRSGLEEEQRKVIERDSLMADLKTQITKKDERVQELEQDVAKKAKTVKDLIEKVSQLSFENMTSKQQIESLSQKSTQLEAKNEEMLIEIVQKTQQLRETEITCMQALDESQRTATEVSRLSNDLSSAHGALQELTDKINGLEAAQDTLQRDISGKDQLLMDAEEKYHKLEHTNVQDIEAALARLKETMEVAKQEALSKLTAELEQRKLDAVNEKLMELQELQERLTKTNDQFDVKIQQFKDDFYEEKHNLQLQVSELEKSKTQLEAKLQSTSATLEEQNAEISSHLLAIQHLSSTVKTLEVDKADLFQKMVHVDRQIRGEMIEKFQKEKNDLEAILRDQHQTDIENLKEMLRIHYEQDAQNALIKVRAFYTEDIDRIQNENQKKVEGFLAETSEKEHLIAQLSREKEEVEQALEDAIQKHDHDMKEAHAESLRILAQEKAKWENETQSRETQLKVSATLALANTEKRFAVAQAELEATHKKQIDELRSFHNISSLAAKKELELQRQNEITRLKNAYADQVTVLLQERDKMLADLELKITLEKQDEIQKLTDEFNSTIDKKDEAIGELQRDAIEKQDKILTLNERVDNLEEQLAESKRNLEAAIELTKQHDINARKRIEEQANQFEAHFKREMELVRTDHIRELQLMLQDFEKAKTYLKRQIANQTKMLQEAEVKYINREPREVDLQRIAELEQHVNAQKHKAEILMEELGYYKLEMNNREANFNKIFNKAPLVGLMQPLTLAQKKNKLKDRLDPSGPAQRLPPLLSMPSNGGTPPDFAVISG